MDIIINYVESMFYQLPKTPEVLDLKQEILSNLEEKFNAFVQTGMGEAEAIGYVLKEFGNIEEIKHSFGFYDSCERNNNSYNLNEMEMEILEDYQLFQRMKNPLTALASGLFIAALVFFSLSFMVLDKTNVIIPMIALLFSLSISIGLFIYLHLEKRKFSKLNIGEKKDWKQRAEFYEDLQGILWISTIIIYVILGLQFRLWHPGWIIFLFATLITIIIDSFETRCKRK